MTVTEVSEVGGRKNHSWNLGKENLAFPSFQLQYKSEAVSPNLLNSLEGERMTGFLQDSNGTQLTGEAKDKGGLSWDARSKKNGSEYHEVMRKTIQLAKDMTLLNVSEDKMVEKVITNKIISTNFLRTPEGLCSEGQFLSGHEEGIYRQLSNLTAFEVNETKRETNMTGIGEADDLNNMTDLKI